MNTTFPCGQFLSCFFRPFLIKHAQFWMLCLTRYLSGLFVLLYHNYLVVVKMTHQW